MRSRPIATTQLGRMLTRAMNSPLPVAVIAGAYFRMISCGVGLLPGVNPTPQEIIRKYAPAITATGSGLFMALVNILPQWVVRVGRDLIRSLAGAAPPARVVPLTPAQPPEPDREAGIVRGSKP